MLLGLCGAAALGVQASQVIRLPHVEVTSAGISDTYTDAIARTVEAARPVAIEQFGFDMPAAIYVSAIADPEKGTRLFNDGDDRINLTAVRIYGSRCGPPQPPPENASLWLCDASFTKIAEFPCLYSMFQRGDPTWVTIPVRPTQVPSEFVVCVAFNPTATKGVFVHYDGSGRGNSFQTLPGSRGRSFAKGDWLIRAVVQEAAD